MLEPITINTHSSIRIASEKVIYADPFRITEESHDADIILITHSHYDHFSPEDIRKVMKSDTILVCPASMKGAEETGLETRRLAPGESADVLGINIETVPAFNKLKPFHPKSSGWVGYIISLPELGRIFIAGDTDENSENSRVKCDIAMLPVGGTYTMNAKAAAKLANTISPKYAIPTHYGSVAGSPEDGEKFCSLLSSGITGVIKISE